MLGGGLRLVEALQGAIVALVQPPVRGLRQPHPVHPVERDPERADRPPEDGGEAWSNSIASAPQQIAGPLRLLDAGVDRSTSTQPVKRFS